MVAAAKTKSSSTNSGIGGGLLISSNNSTTGVTTNSGGGVQQSKQGGTSTSLLVSPKMNSSHHHTHRHNNNPTSPPEGRSAEGSTATSSSINRREESSHGSSGGGGGPPLLELQKSPGRVTVGVGALPKNPRDTATYDSSESGKLQRRLQQQQMHHPSGGGGSVKSANSWTSWGKRPTQAAASQSGHSIGGRSYKSAKSAILPPLKPTNTSSTASATTSTAVNAAAAAVVGTTTVQPPPPAPLGMRNRTSSGSLKDMSKSPRKMNHPPPPPPLPSSSSTFGSPSLVVPPGTIPTNTNNNTTTSTSSINATTTVSTAPNSLDDEEQYMFEQRLTHDELGVAIRKISHSGKAQLRYVKCVVLRPPSSDDFGESGVDIVAPTTTTNNTTTSGGIPGIGTYLEKTNTEAAQQRKKTQSQDNISVSSSVSSRFMEKIKSMVGRGGSNTNNNTSSGGGNGAISGSIHGGGEGEEDDDNNSLLLHDTMSTSRAPPNNNNNSGGSSGGITNTALGGHQKSLRALTWGKKNAITIPLDRFACVRKGKTTERTMRNGAAASRLLSIVVGNLEGGDGVSAMGSGSSGRESESLDIEAPTRLDRDKFASAFARFLGVPLIEEEVVEGERGERNNRGGSARRKLRTPSLTRRKKASMSSNHSTAAASEPGLRNHSTTARSSSSSIDAAPVQPQPPPKVRRPTTNTADTSSLLPALTPNSDEDDADNELAFFDPEDRRKQTIGATAAAPTDAAAIATTTRENTTTTTTTKIKPRSVVSREANTATPVPSVTGSSIAMSESARKRIVNTTQSESMLEPQDKTLMLGASPAVAAAEEQGPTINALNDDVGDDASHVSSLTGGVDQEIVEELHQAIIELRAELDASRAEAARAVKVAEQAIQSAENCSSSDWNSTVTHKAAEAAAQAQKKSAEAIARARMAEERLSAERKSTSFWRRQAQAAEEEAGSLKTRSAGAEVKQAVLMEELASERRKAARMFASLRQEFVNAEKVHAKELNDAQEKKRTMEMELEHVKKELIETKEEVQRIVDAEEERKAKGSNRMALSFRSARKKSSGSITAMTPEKSMARKAEENETAVDVSLGERTLALESGAQVLRRECDQLRLQSTDEINALKLQSREWANLADRAVAASRAETEHLREKLAAESAMRLKLLNELQDIRGTIRVYCRPKPGATKPILTIPTQDILIVNEDSKPVSFKFDRVFSPGTSQYELFSEVEEPILSSLDGFNVTMLAFGQHGSGKTHSILGDRNIDETGSPKLQSHGVQLQALQQLFTIAGHRKGRYKDSFSVTMVEVHNEKLFDLISGVSAAKTDGEIVICETRRDKRKGIDESDWRRGKLEIRTNIDGNTVVQGLVSIRINSFEDVCQIWQESIKNRLERLQMQGADLSSYERNTNVITTIHIQSTNIATGVGTEGRLQFVDMAASDIMPNTASVDGDQAKFSNKSIDAFNDVVDARCQFDRSVPYRNSTLTHLLRDSLEADAKVLLLCCISSDEADMDNTMSALRFASRMQSVSIGKATKHIIGSKE